MKYGENSFRYTLEEKQILLKYCSEYLEKIFRTIPHSMIEVIISFLSILLFLTIKLSQRTSELLLIGFVNDSFGN